MTTPTQIRTAILKAADHIEGNPGLFDFGEVGFPDCGSPGCALGWVGFFLGMTRPYGLDDVSFTLGCENPNLALMFYDRMTELCGGFEWKKDAALCAKGLQLYANKHFPETETYPEVQAELERIFAGEVTV